MRRSSDYNFRRLAEFQALNAVAIALGANWVITDMILLRMNFDLSRFGVIKSSMFLLPALAYWAAAGLLRKLTAIVWSASGVILPGRFCRWPCRPPLCSLTTAGFCSPSA